jgi:hypothetical protein
MILVALSWIPIVGGELVAWRTGRGWPRGFTFSGCALLTLQALVGQVELPAETRPGVITGEVLSVPGTRIYHKPGCPFLDPVHYPDAGSAEFVECRQCSYCFKR